MRSATRTQNADSRAWATCANRKQHAGDEVVVVVLEEALRRMLRNKILCTERYRILVAGTVMVQQQMIMVGWPTILGYNVSSCHLDGTIAFAVYPAQSEAVIGWSCNF